MDITFHGHSCFTIKGKSATIITDPYAGLGTNLPNLKADIVTLGDEYAEKMGEVAVVEGEPKVLNWPGEFEVANVTIESLGAKHFAKIDTEEGDDVNIFIFNIDGIKICHLSGLGHELSDELLDHIGDVDILMVPVGGNVVLEGKGAQKLVESIEPRVVIPMYYAATETKMNLDGVAEFLKAVGQSNLEPQEKYSVSGKSSLPEDKMEFILLEPKL
ncbi:MBL fold metallo-hydrolase [Patescibacteria group bacterium]|nr:MBL fold metallo-hydrolase [Patescibacteria group bacterium]